MFRLSLQNTGVVDLDYEWQIMVIDRQTAMDFLSAAAAGPTSVSPPSSPPVQTLGSVSPPSAAVKTGADGGPGKTASSGGSPGAVGSSVKHPSTASPPQGTGTSPPGGTVASPLAGTTISPPGGAGASPPRGAGTSPPGGTGTTPPGGPATSPPRDTSTTPAVTSPQQADIKSLASMLLMTSHSGDGEYMPFSVTPSSGEVAAGAAADILVKFSPLDVTEYYACLFARYTRHCIK